MLLSKLSPLPLPLPLPLPAIAAGWPQTWLQRRRPCPTVALTPRMLVLGRSYFVDNQLATNRNGGLKLLRQLVISDCIHHVTDSEEAKDEKLFFRCFPSLNPARYIPPPTPLPGGNTLWACMATLSTPSTEAPSPLPFLPRLTTTRIVEWGQTPFIPPAHMYACADSLRPFLAFPPPILQSFSAHTNLVVSTSHLLVL